ncbi:sigma factor-like helix-turn-helix DNA-binding protein [Actinomadura craniellae]|uniref:sigma factor-like helix-turn-helix DNA-binding protein n=1 Tax=Actinomadura craniellae TaxID=2231787 RepID=UPI001F415577|nr:sigma factor-like helix-turn-helix DNA-binding protein [Actinomadura craniellae]
MRSANVSQALHSLSSAHREILVETYFRRRSVNEAASVLGLPVETVKTRVYEALHALRAALDAVDPPRPARPRWYAEPGT